MGLFWVRGWARRLDWTWSCSCKRNSSAIMGGEYQGGGMEDGVGSRPDFRTGNMNIGALGILEEAEEHHRQWQAKRRRITPGRSPSIIPVDTSSFWILWLIHIYRWCLLEIYSVTNWTRYWVSFPVLVKWGKVNQCSCTNGPRYLLDSGNVSWSRPLIF